MCLKIKNWFVFACLPRLLLTTLMFKFWIRVWIYYCQYFSVFSGFVVKKKTECRQNVLRVKFLWNSPIRVNYLRKSHSFSENIVDISIEQKKKAAEFFVVYSMYLVHARKTITVIWECNFVITIGKSANTTILYNFMEGGGGF